MMDVGALTSLAVIAGVASYLQTVTGFAFGLVFMGTIAATGMIGIEDGATIVSILVMVNGTQILVTNWRHVSLKSFLQIVPVALAATVAGALLLPFLLAKSLVWLKFILGLVVIVSSLRLLHAPASAPGFPRGPAMTLSGLAGGIMGGMFAIPGPPIVYVIHRYLRTYPEIRATLVAIFSTIIGFRLVFSSLVASPSAGILVTSLLLVPVAITVTALAQRYPPPLTARMMTAITVSLLVLIGLILMLPAVASLF